jgi:hypothetical protein
MIQPKELFIPVEDSPEFKTTMSAHEAGHATMGITLGARVEAVYARILDRTPNGNFRLCYLTRFGSFREAGLDLKDQILLIAGGAAGELVLNGAWDEKCVAIDQAEAKALGVSNFSHCISEGIKLLRENIVLLTAVRNHVKTSMLDLKDCNLAKGNTHIILAKGHEIERLYRAVGFPVTSAKLDLSAAGVHP